jgi:hypothetical protein
MTPIEKAQDLFHNYEVQVRFSMEDCSFTYRDSNYGLTIKRTAKQCALIAVDEVLENSHTNVFTNYWNEVKHEIKKL